MHSQDELGGAARTVLDGDEVQGVLTGAFYNPAAPSRQKPTNTKPTHYKVICISMYTDDLKRLDEMVDSLKAKGMTKANRSALIRHALNQVDIENVPKGI